MIQVLKTGTNPHLEKRLLSCCLNGGSSDVLAASGAGIVDATFGDPTSRMLWQALTQSVAANTGTEVEAVARFLTGLEGSNASAIAILSEVMPIEPTSISRTKLIEDVLSLARRRRLVNATALAASEACSGSHREWDEVWEATEPHLRAAQESSTDARQRTIAEIATIARQQLMKPDPREIISSGLLAWDRNATPPRAGQMIVIAARPGAGKSALAGQIAHHIASHGKQVAFFCLEMSTEEVVTRMARLRCYPKAGFDDQVAEQIDALGKLKDLKLYDVDSAKTTAQIEAHCRLLAASPRGLGAVVIDYLQLVSPPADSRRENREQQVAAMSRAFKLLARSVKAPVFLLAQLNREVEKDEGRAPRLSDLRESGSIEQDADRVWFLYQPKPRAGEMAPSKDSPVIDVALLQAKCRNGPAGIQDVMKFHRKHMCFVS